MTLYQMSDSLNVNSRIKRLRLTKSAAVLRPATISKLEKEIIELPKQWMYGLRLKFRDYHRICKQWNLPWEEDPFVCMDAISDWVIRATGVYFKLHIVTYRGETAQIVTFAIDKNRQLKNKEFSNDAMENVRKLFGIKHKPRWFELYDRNSPDEDEDALSSGDEEFPHVDLERRVDDDDDDDLEVVNESNFQSESESE